MDKEKFNQEDCIDFIVSKTIQNIKNTYFREFKANHFNITSEQWAVISYLHKEDGIYQKQIGDYLAKDKPTVTRILDLLEKRKLVIRIPDEKDRRKFKIYLTQDGKNTADKISPIAENTRKRILNDVSKDEIEKLKELMDKLYKNTL